MDQSEVVAFLSRPESYGVTAPVERIETHISFVFLAGDRAYKLKRAIRFPYLDFSTPALRREACHAELALNRRTAPRLYRTVRSIRRDRDGRFVIDGDQDGSVVDWVVEMERFDGSLLFDKLAGKGRLDRALMEQTAECVAGFHSRAPVEPRFGGRLGIEEIVSSNAACFADLPADVVDREAAASLTESSFRELDRVSLIAEARRHQGMVRHCHGDLHLRNIVLYAGVPTLFDAIEFSESIARIDVLYDLAFLLMDLERRELSGLAAIVLNRYLDVAPGLLCSERGLALLPLFLSLRAAVRAHVNGAVAARTDDRTERSAAASETAAYLDMADDYLRPSPPRLVAVGGLSGSGKSRAARVLACDLPPAPGARVLRSDVIRKKQSGYSLTASLPSDFYAPEVSRRTYDEMYHRAAEALAAGHSVIADAVFARPDERAAIEQVAVRAGVPFQGVWLEAAPEVMSARIAGRTGDASDATPEVLSRQLNYDLGRMAWPRVDSGGEPAETMARVHAVVGVGR